MTAQRSTKQDLINAAIAEFDAFGFEGTNTNRIARAANYAPQTFYRHFEDKTAVFLAVYQLWYYDKLDQVAVAHSRMEAAKIIVETHRATLMFRRSLRQRAGIDRRVAAARAVSRNLQIDRLATVAPNKTRTDLAACILTIERLADAIAEGEFVDLGLADFEALRQLAGQIFWIEK